MSAVFLVSEAMVSRIRVLTIHNRYQFRGGEDSVVEAETALLQKMGHEVELFSRHNHDLASSSKARAAVQAVWSRESAAAVRDTISKFQPEIIHVHNTWPLVSPSIYWEAYSCRVPVVQTLHNFRLLCPQAMFLRNGQVCEDCLGKIPWRGVVRNCYRDSKLQSAVMCMTLVVHRIAGTWDKRIDRYIALNEFSRTKFVAGGIPPEKLVVKPNFVEVGAPCDGKRSGFLFVGRLSPEKGLSVLVQAAQQFSDQVVSVVGEGPSAALLAHIPIIKAFGHQPAKVVYEKMANSLALIFPSIWYETFGMVIVEAFACGLPVIASRIGGVPELVEDGQTGLLFEPGDAESLKKCMRWALENPNKMAEMGRRARASYEANYAASKNYEKLVAIYEATRAEFLQTERS